MSKKKNKTMRQSLVSASSEGKVGGNYIMPRNFGNQSDMVGQ